MKGAPLRCRRATHGMEGKMPEIMTVISGYAASMLVMRLADAATGGGRLGDGVGQGEREKRKREVGGEGVVERVVEFVECCEGDVKRGRERVVGIVGCGEGVYWRDVVGRGRERKGVD